jgi:hypothetical protein
MPSVPTDEFMALITRTVEDYMRRVKNGNVSSGKGVVPSSRSHWAICNEEITAASNGVTTPSTGDIEFLARKRSSNALERTGIIKTLTHRYEGITLEEDTLIRVKHADGEWMLEAADCEAMGSPPA